MLIFKRVEWLLPLNLSSPMVQGQYDDIKESSILEGYRCRDDGCNGFLLRDSGTTFEHSYICVPVSVSETSFVSVFIF